MEFISNWFRCNSVQTGLVGISTGFVEFRLNNFFQMGLVRISFKLGFCGISFNLLGKNSVQTSLDGIPLRLVWLACCGGSVRTGSVGAEFFLNWLYSL